MIETKINVMEVLHECLIALQLAENKRERDLIRAQIHKLEQYITS